MTRTYSRTVLLFCCSLSLGSACSRKTADSSTAGGGDTAGMEPAAGGDAAGMERAAAEDPPAALMEKGKKLFDQHCATCHQQNGEGVPGAFPPLAGNPHLKSASLIVTTIHKGKSGPITVEGKKFNGTMPPIGASFSPEQTAAVATYVRNAWGNDFGVVTKAHAEKLMSGMSP